MRNLQTTEETMPVIMRVGKIAAMDTNIYDHRERYDHNAEMLEEGTYFMGSDTKNTRCTKFTILGSDKTHNDDTKEK
tara:strand:- start:1596 stop:1826 length:231 start_codon:yes stop_codon:yes gene_type:complete